MNRDPSSTQRLSVLRECHVRAEAALVGRRRLVLAMLVERVGAPARHRGGRFGTLARRQLRREVVLLFQLATARAGGKGVCAAENVQACSGGPRQQGSGRMQQSSEESARGRESGGKVC